MKKIGIIAGSAAVIAILILGSLYFHFKVYSETPAGNDPALKLFTIRRGQDFATTTRLLHDAGFIKHPFKYRILARLKGYDKRVKAGEYTLSATMSPIQILDKLVAGKVKLYRLTIPEGSNLEQIAAMVEEAGFHFEGNILYLSGDERTTPNKY